MDRAELRSVALRVVALALLLALTLVAVLTTRTLQRLPDARVYLVRTLEGRFELEAVPRRFGSDGPERFAIAAVAALAAGPSSSEAASGLSSEVPTGTRAQSARFDAQDGTLQVDLSGEVQEGGGSASMRGRLEQLRWTLTGPASVRRLELYVDGERLWVLGGEGLLVDPQWTRPDGDPPRW